MIYGAKYFHQYLYGCKSVLVTHYKPLLAVLVLKSGIPTLAAALLQRWALLLAAYSDEIEFQPTGEHADANSCSVCLWEAEYPPETGFDFTVGQIQALPVTAAQW